jgi:hypothetical protein
MYITAQFHGDDDFSHLIDTNKLEESLKQEVETAVSQNRFAEFFGFKYFKAIQDGAIFGKENFPVTIQGMIDVYLD